MHARGCYCTSLARFVTDGLKETRDTNFNFQGWSNLSNRHVDQIGYGRSMAGKFRRRSET